MDRRNFIQSSIGAILAAQTAEFAQGRSAQRLGVNLIEDPLAPFGSAQSRACLKQIKRAGAQTVAIVPFFWQANGSDPNLVSGSALPLERLKTAISDLRELDLCVMVKPHVWVPDRWAGSVTICLLYTSPSPRDS